MDPKPRKRRRRLLLGLLLLLARTHGGYRAFSRDPALDEVRALRQELANSELTEEQRREKRSELRAAMEKLTQEQRREEGKAMAEEGRKRFEAEMKRYAAMTPKEKTHYLDQQIDRQEERRRQAQANPPSNRPPQGTPSQGNSTRPPSSPEDRERRRKQMLDNTTPEFRAHMDQYQKDLAARRQQRGIPAPPPRGGPR